MNSHNLKSFLDQVHKMRLAQERYFELARQSGNHIHAKEKKDALVIAKNLEKQVDQSILEINNQPTAAEGVAKLGDAIERLDKSYFATENF